MTEKALTDLKIIELGEFVSVPYCTKLFADLGAEVIKIEKPGFGDVSRRLGPFPGDIPDAEKSGLFLFLNTNKLGITLDIYTATGREILKELLKEADVFVESCPRKVVEELELDYGSLKKINPQLIMTSVTPWGHTGPYKDYKGYDINISAAGGASCRVGDPERQPLTMPAYQASYYAATTAAGATMLAVYAREIGYPGQHIDISEVRCWATTFSLGATNYLKDQALAVRTGRHQPRQFPFDILRIKDGMLLLLTITDAEWQGVCEIIGKPEWIADPRFRTMYSRDSYREELISQMKPWLMSHTREEVFNLAREKKMLRACAPLQSIAEMIGNPHLEERNFFTEIEHPLAGNLKYVGPPYQLSETPWSIDRPAPCLGEHNEPVYGSRLGYSRQKLTILRRSGVI